MTAGQHVGLDVELSNRHTRGNPLRLARRRFSAAELASLEGILPRSCNTCNFVRLPVQPIITALWLTLSVQASSVTLGLDQSCVTMLQSAQRARNERSTL